MNYDVLVIGGGHAGCEAAHASARLGCTTALIITDKNAIARMSCNPAVGGPGKSQIVREVDALGGLMAEVTDKSGLQFRTLNASKGPAVRALRAQADVHLYSRIMRAKLEAVADLTIIEGSAVAVTADNGKVTGITLDSGEKLSAKAVIVCTGTFLNGLMHTGNDKRSGGRVGEPPSTQLSDSLRELGFTLGRLKTGTPPRLDKTSIDYSRLEEQPGDLPPPSFSMFKSTVERPALPCHLTYTNENTHEIIRNAFGRSPLFSGIIQGVGPRYCPSIEDKVARFPAKTSHHIFLEPVSQECDLVYPNGVSTSLPADVQDDFIHSIPGLENAVIIEYGYAVEYDFAPPTQVYPTLETKLVEGLYFAGQINGTSGYEEAAGQGILAGINSARKLRGREPLILKRSESYIGVMVDDLTTLGTQEPYRMFTSRAEHRLVMRQDNADVRLCETGREVGLLTGEKYRIYMERQKKISELIEQLSKATIKPDKETLALMSQDDLPSIEGPVSLAGYLRRPEVTLNGSSLFGDLSAYDKEEMERAEIEIKYEGYIARQKKWIKELENVENIALASDLDYASVPGLSTELSQKLSAIRPLTFGQASRIAGITPAALSILMVHLRTRRRKT